jgi:ubiquitin C-terminal hydrolase
MVTFILQVKGMRTLDTSLQTLLGADALTGSNQYLCDFCGMKTDADRSFCIRKTPPCLRLNLSRFNFDFNTGTKQKVRF